MQVDVLLFTVDLLHQHHITKNCCGEGPAWASSLFEDNAEYGFGMHVGVEALRDRIQHIMEVSMDKVTPALQGLFREWIENRLLCCKDKRKLLLRF